MYNQPADPHHALHNTPATLGDEEDDSDDQKPDKRSGRRKIKIEYIEDKSRRHITFSKRKAGIMKKASLQACLCLCLLSETGLVYTFTTPKLQPIVMKPEGKNLIQSCLNAPEAASDLSMPDIPVNVSAPPTPAPVNSVQVSSSMSLGPSPIEASYGNYPRKTYTEMPGLSVGPSLENEQTSYVDSMSYSLPFGGNAQPHSTVYPYNVPQQSAPVNKDYWRTRSNGSRVTEADGNHQYASISSRLLTSLLLPIVTCLVNIKGLDNHGFVNV
ncbi:MADS-box transcription factor [Phycomyces blakesleeanus]